MFGFEPAFADPVLLGVMEATQAEAPAIGGFEGRAAVCAGPDMGAFDR